MERGAFREVDGSQVNEDLHNRISLDFKSLPLAVWRFGPALAATESIHCRARSGSEPSSPCWAPHFANNAALSALKLFIASQISVPECCAKRSSPLDSFVRDRLPWNPRRFRNNLSR